MANYQDLKDSISALIRQNGAQEITGDVLQGVLVSMVANLGQNYQFKGIAVPTGNPGTPDQNVFYFATQQGTYTNFGGTKIDKDSLFVLAYNGEWTSFDTGVSAMPKDLHFLVDSNMAIAPYENNVTLEMDVYDPSTASSQVKEYQIPSATEEFAGVMSAADKKTLDGMKDNARRYDYLKINGLTTSSTSEQVKAALTPIEGTEVVFPTNGNTITNGTSISIEILAATSNTFSYIYNNQLVTLGFSLAEGREAVTSKVQTSLLKPMYDFAKINALTGESGNDEIEAAIKQLQTSKTTAPSAGALLVDASTLAPLAVVTDSSSNAPSMTEVFSYTHGGVKYTVEISGEQGALTAKVTTQAVTQRRYDYSVWVGLNDTSQMDECLAALTPIGETTPAWPKVGDLLCDASDPATIRSLFASVTPLNDTTFIFLFLTCIDSVNAYLFNIAMQDNEDGTYSVIEENNVDILDIPTLKRTVSQQGTQIQSNTTNLNLQSRNFDISNMVQVVGVGSYGGSGFDSVCVRAPKGLLWDSMQVRLYRKIKGRSTYSDLGTGRNNRKDRLKKGWLNFCNFERCGQILAKLEQVQTRDNMNSGYNANDGYDYFNIRVIDKRTYGEEYSKLFSEMVKDNCYFSSIHQEDGWDVLHIKNGHRKKTLFNPAHLSSFDTVVNNKYRVTTWGFQIQNEDSSVKYPYTGIIPFHLQITVGELGKEYAASTINNFGYDDINITLVKSV